jgi:hypothetical protein
LASTAVPRAEGAVAFARRAARPWTRRSIAHGAAVAPGPPCFGPLARRLTIAAGVWLTCQ